MSQRRRGRGWIGWILGLVVVLVLAWLGYWTGVRTTAIRAFARAEAGPIAGYDVACSDRTIGGFPLRIDVACGPLSVAARAGVMNAELGSVSATAPLYRPGAVMATLTGPLTLNAPLDGLAVTAAWSLGESEATAGLNGLRSAAARFLSVEVENAAGNPVLPVVAARARRLEGSATPAGGDAYRFSAAAADLLLARRGGAALPETDIDVAVRALDFRRGLGTKPHLAVLGWLRRGGTLEIEQARIAAGDAIVDADGTLTISRDGVLSGSLDLRFNDLDALADLIETLRPGSRENLEPALAALMAMTVPVDTPDGPARQTALAINNGLVAVGIIPVGVLPALRFR